METYSNVVASDPSLAARGRTRGARNELASLEGEVVAGYQVERVVGRGELGTVYRARNPLLGTFAALRLLEPDVAADAGRLRRYLAEARLANQAGHERIARVFSLERHPEHGAYVLMEWAEGESLATVLRRGPAPFDWLEQVLLQLCSALGAAHARGIYQGGLEPEHVVVAERHGKPEVKLTGFAQQRLRASAPATPYLSPEQCELHAFDGRADIYALGVMAYELATGELPFTGSEEELLAAHLTHPAPSAREKRPELPWAWDAVIRRAMAKRPDARFVSMQAFAEGLRAREDRPAPRKKRAAIRARVCADVELQLAEGQPIAAVALELSRAGTLLAYEGATPGILTRVRLKLLGGEPLETEAEVVRHIGDEGARAWGLPPRIALEFVEPSAAFCARVDELAERAGAPATVQLAGGLWSAGEAARPADPYEVLGLPPDCTRAQILDAGNKRMADLGLRRMKAQSVETQRVIGEELHAVASAMSVLLPLEERLRHDARRGNAAGVARSVAAGCPPDVVEREHATFLRERPAVAGRVQELLGCVRAARREGREPAAQASLRLALMLDPLHLTLHELAEPPTH